MFRTNLLGAQQQHPLAECWQLEGDLIVFDGVALGLNQIEEIAEPGGIKEAVAGGREGPADLDELAEPADYDQTLAGLDEALTVRACLDAVGDPCREILDRFFCQDESYKSIGDALDLPAGTIASRISRCLSKVKAELEGRS